jgi:isochorismate synthase EntC
MQTNIKTTVNRIALPPILSRDNTDSSDFECGVQYAIDSFSDNTLKKVVLAQKSILNLGSIIENPIDVLLRMRENLSNNGGHFYMLQINLNQTFLGCTPERLFLVEKQKKHWQVHDPVVRQKKKT